MYEDCRNIKSEVIEAGLRRGIDLTAGSPTGNLYNDARGIGFDREHGRISYALQGCVTKLPKIFEKSPNSFHGQYSESGECANIDEAVDLAAAWLLERLDADDLPKRSIGSRGIG